MKSTIQFLRYTSIGYRARIGVIILIGLFEVAFSLVFVWYSKVIIDTATGAQEGSLLYYAILLVVLIALQILFRLLDIRMRRMTEVRMANSIRYNVFSHLLYTRWEELSTMHSGDMITRIIKDTDDVISMMVTALPLTIVAITQFVSAVVLRYILDPMLAIILGVGMPLLGLLSKVYYTYMRKYTLQVKESESMITAMVGESLLNQVVIRSFEQQENELERLDKLQSDSHESVHKRTNVSIFANLMMGLTFNGGYITAFLWSTYGLAKQTVTFGMVTAYLQLVNRIQRPLFNLIRLLPSIVAAKTAVERLIFLTGFKLEEHKNRVLLEGDVTLSIDNVSFAYGDEERPVLSDFSMVVKPGTMVAVMGETGVGKTTLLRLLLALIQPNSGSISIEDATGQVAVSESTRANFVYVPQGASLFSGSIRNNLLLGNKDASDEEAWFVNQ